MPATPEWHKEARRLHEETDLTQSEIAERLGKSKSSISRALNPEKTATREVARRPYKRAWDNENLYDTCECGRRKQRSRVRCRTCFLNGEEFKRRFSELLLIEMWKDGLDSVEIGRELGWKPRSVSVRVAKLRARGVDLPYRRRDAEELTERMRGLVKERVERQAAAE